ncbi:MAG: bile acid:sodium symporter family protein [Bacteroidales bacterium]|jgi:BASS family bile acid:Na+ symporter|nr:bile acid:sodium symporter family protein [Bacteroidales bacterium]
MKNRIYGYLLIMSVLLIAGSLLSYFTGNIPLTSILLISGFVALATGVRGYPKVKGLSYTLWIFTAVVVSLFYPQYLTSIGNFKLSRLITPLLQLIMFGMGSQMSFNDFAGIIRMPKGVIIGVISQFTLMPLIALGIAAIFSFPPEIAAGIILIGCVPSGLASNVMSFLARANVPLAVTLAAVTTLLSPFVTPFLMENLAGQFIEVDFWNMMLDILNMIILPIVAGFIFNLFLKKEAGARSKMIQLLSYPFIMILTGLVYVRAKDASMTQFLVQFVRMMAVFYFLPMAGGVLFLRVFGGDKKIMEKILSLISMVGIALIVTVITASGRDSLLTVGPLLVVTSILHNLSGYTLGYTLAWLFRMPEKDRRTIAFEVGMQNGGLASGLANQMGKLATVGLAPAIFGPLMNITGSVLANWWRGKPVREDERPESEVAS